MRQSSRLLLLIGPLLLFLAATYLVPFLGVMRWSVTLPEPGLGQYEAALTDPLAAGVGASEGEAAWMRLLDGL